MRVAARLRASLAIALPGGCADLPCLRPQSMAYYAEGDWIILGGHGGRGSLPKWRSVAVPERACERNCMFLPAGPSRSCPSSDHFHCGSAIWLRCSTAWPSSSWRSCSMLSLRRELQKPPVVRGGRGCGLVLSTKTELPPSREFRFRSALRTVFRLGYSLGLAGGRVKPGPWPHWSLSKERTDTCSLASPVM